MPDAAEQEKLQTIRNLRNAIQSIKDNGINSIPLAKPSTPETVGLEAIRAELGDCQRCPLCSTRSNIVFGTGNPKADLVFIGEAPGRDEDLQGEPFVGRSGQLLTKVIGAMGFTRNDVYIANIVKCLRYNAMVQLGNGQWERIGRLVRKKYTGTVMSINQEGHLMPRSVIGWHATPLNDRSVYKLSYRSAKYAGLHKSAIYLTGDHPVFTKRNGYIKVDSLQTNDQIAIGQGFSQTIINLIYGTLLGDGHINSKQSHLSFSHSLKQEVYAYFKAELLKNELKYTINSLAVAAGGDQIYPIIKCYTESHRALRFIRSKFYVNGTKKVPADLARNLNPMMLAFWFMDDGYMRIRPHRKPSAEIATCAFSSEDLNTLVNGIKKIGIESYVRSGRIFFNTEETIKLSETIAPYVCPSMRYKLHPEVANRIDFNPSLFTCGPRETLFDYVEAESIQFNGTDKTFYCIDVEENHNFVTSAGVVHNCRPPDNRYPQADEVETCSPFLFKQLDSIQPKVVVSLGNLATQTLMGTKEGITTLRNKFHDWRGFKLMPTYHPAFLLRNPNMKRPLWEDMQKVMAYLKR